MKNALLFLIAVSLAAPVTAEVVQPTYVGEYGNPEETALRPYKWMWRGVKALFYQTGYGFKHGNMKTPVLGTAETIRGWRKGTFELAESTYRGVVFAPVPPKDSYKQVMKLNQAIDNEKARSNISDLVFSVYAFPLAFPVMKFVDRYPAENESRVEIREQRAQATRAAQDAAEAARKPEMDRLEKAQREYLGDRYPKNSRKDSGRGNLLRLAK